MTLSSVTPYSGADTTAGTTSRTATMPTVQAGDGAIMALACGNSLTPTVTPEAGWTNPFTLVAALTVSGKGLHVYKATNLAATDTGKVLTISTGATSLKMTRGILPIRGGSTVDIVDTFNTKDGGTGNATTGTTPTLTTTAAGCGLLHVVMMRRNDGVAGDWFTSLEPDTGQGLLKDFSVFSAIVSSTTSFNALMMCHDWTALGLGASIPAHGFTADKAGSYFAVTLSIRPAATARRRLPAGTFPNRLQLPSIF